MAMLVVLSLFELSPGTITCLHIPHGFHNAGQAVEHQLFQLAARLGKAISISAGPVANLWRYWVRPAAFNDSRTLELQRGEEAAT